MAFIAATVLGAFSAQAGSIAYSYDSLGRLAAVVFSNGGATTTIAYRYDAAGNRTSVITTSP
ncbi:MAG: hypothetical protein EOO22_02280 [Comamonadaceae bacterium]|nr:MAG: hypothetical protein EOO22_02280 [Comamonadaceae bacterium]